MADIGELDEFGKIEILRRLQLNITRINAQIEENEFKLFIMERDKQRLKKSIEDSKQEINKNQEELKKHKDLWGMK